MENPCSPLLLILRGRRVILSFVFCGDSFLMPATHQPPVAAATVGVKPFRTISSHGRTTSQETHGENKEDNESNKKSKEFSDHPLINCLCCFLAEQ